MPIISSRKEDGKVVYTGTNIVLTMLEGYSHRSRDTEILDMDGYRFIPHVCLMLAEEFDRAGVVERFNAARFCLSLDSVVPPDPDHLPLQARNITVNAIFYAVDSTPEASLHNRASSGLAAGICHTHNSFWQTHQFSLTLKAKLKDSNQLTSYFNCGLLISRY